MNSKVLIFAVACLPLLATLTEAKVYGRCEFVRLARKHFPENEIDDWTCIAQHESSFNTKALNKNTNGSTDYGIFQINNYYWCSPPTKNDICKVACKRLLEDNLVEAIKCAKIVKKQQGFTAWVAYNNKCSNGRSKGYSKGC